MHQLIFRNEFPISFPAGVSVGNILLFNQPHPTCQSAFIIHRMGPDASSLTPCLVDSNYKVCLNFEIIYLLQLTFDLCSSVVKPSNFRTCIVRWRLLRYNLFRGMGRAPQKSFHAPRSGSEVEDKKANDMPKRLKFKGGPPHLAEGIWTKPAPERPCVDIFNYSCIL